MREATLTRLLTQHRIRRVDAAILRGRLRTPAVKVASGAAEAAIAHVRLVAERLALVNRQLDHAAPPARPIGAATHRGRAGRRPDRVRGGRTSVVEHTG